MHLRLWMWPVVLGALLVACGWEPGQDCGDGVVQGTEECDDTNHDPGDGCHRCRVEDGWQCHGEPSECCLLYWQGPSCTGPCMVFVDRAAQAEAPDGLSWASSFARIQEGIDAAQVAGDGCEVWVAEGRYPIWQGSRADTVRLASHTSLYGGFAGTETTRDQRDWQGRPTILDGRDDDADAPWLRVRHVVSASGIDGVTLDGFTITGGDATEVGVDLNDDDPELFSGGGLWVHDATVLVRNNLFVDNHAGHGGGLAVTSANTLNPLVITHCKFLRNTADHYGGGFAAGMVFPGGASQVQIDACEFDDNEATSGGALASRSAYSLSITDSQFRRNRATWSGGAAYVETVFFEMTITSSLFAENEAERSGAIFLNSASWNQPATIADTVLVMNRAEECGAIRVSHNPIQQMTRFNEVVFAGNTSDGTRLSAGAVCLDYPFNREFTIFEDVLFSANHAAHGAGAILAYFNSAQISRTAFLGNSGDGFSSPHGGGGAIALFSMSGFPGRTEASDSIFAGNHGRWGGAIATVGYRLDATNVTFVANVADEEGGALFTGGNMSRGTCLSNSILWDNQSLDATQIAYDGDDSLITVSHCLVEGGYQGDANLDADPLFVGYPDPVEAGVWTQGVYDPETYQTRLVDAGASWIPGELVGVFLKPSGGDPRWLWIVDNDDTGIVVWADMTSWVGPGHSYAVYDLRLSAASPAIDVGDDATASATDFSGHPRVDVVDLGAFEYQP